MKIHDCEQGTDEWFRLRLGKPTASMFSTILANGRGGAPSKTRDTYMRELAGEIITGEPQEAFSNGYLERGKEMESEARKAYAMIEGATPELIGFVTNDDETIGASPDSFVGNDGMLEIKTQAPHLLIETLKKGQFPPEHIAQCQGNLWVCEREWIDISVYYSGMPVFTKRAGRDEIYIAKLKSEVERFRDELAALVDEVRGYGC